MSFEARPLKRADWQRFEGMILSYELAEEVFSGINDLVDDRELNRAMRRQLIPNLHPVYSQAEAVAVTALRLAQTRFPKSDLTRFYNEPGDTDLGLNLYTYPGRPYGISLEATSTALMFPVNIAEVARRQSAGRFQYQTIGALGQTIMKPWFEQVINIAAFAPNGTWGSFSSNTLSARNVASANVANPENYERYLQFTYDVDETGQTFDFTDVAKAGLLRAVGNRNHQARSSNIRPAYQPESTWGTTAGCPARLRHPTYQDSADNQAMLRRMADIYDKPTEALLMERPISGIGLSLQALGNLLIRADSLQT